MKKRLKKKKSHEIIRHVKTLKADKGDIIIVSVKSAITDADGERIRSLVNRVLPNNKVLVVDDGSELTLIKQPNETVNIYADLKTVDTDINKVASKLGWKLKEASLNIAKAFQHMHKGVGGM